MSIPEITLPLMVKLGSIAVHAEEYLSDDGALVDREALLAVLNDPEVQDWLREMGPLVPVRRAEKDKETS